MQVRLFYEQEFKNSFKPTNNKTGKQKYVRIEN